MTTRVCGFIKPAIFILILCIFAAGCTSTPEVKPVPATPIPIEYLTKVPIPVTTPQVTATLSDDGSKTCSQLQGTVAIPGQVCPGTWLTASDSFSCCSKTPVAGKTTKTRLAADPLDLRILNNDTFVVIGTG
jgi:hypothetical protein